MFQANDSLIQWIQSYENDASHNSQIHKEFTNRTDEINWLKHHRDIIEANQWGTGDRAFHYMWYLIFASLAERSKPLRCLEIGVYKGQVISLWALLAKQFELNTSIRGISPFEGNARKPMMRGVHKIKRILSPNYRKLSDEGNLYEKLDYLEIVHSVFKEFNLAMDKINLIKGYSTQSNIVSDLSKEKFDVIYIDGDHSFEGVKLDIENFSPLLESDGFLVMDDASYFLPGEGFWKGHKAVSLACEEIPQQKFMNILNVGHNRIYKRV